MFNYDVLMIAAEAMKKSGKPFDRKAVNDVFLSKDFSYQGIVGYYEFDQTYHWAKYGKGFITFVTKQEWGGKSTTLYPTEVKDGDFQLPPWYQGALKKYGN